MLLIVKTVSFVNGPLAAISRASPGHTSDRSVAGTVSGQAYLAEELMPCLQDVRGVTCRAMADDLGSRTIIRSEHWKAMRASGVRAAAGLPIGNPLLRPFRGRIDLRNHRKIVVIDDLVTYCGSQNCVDPER